MATIPTIYYQTTNDLGGERLMDARSIGLLDKDRTMLNLQSALATASDKVDNYRFRMIKDGPIGLSGLVSDKEGTQLEKGALKIELLNRAGRVIADSTATGGVAKENWDKLAATSFDGKKGDYYVRVTRGPESSKTAVLQYNIQVRSTFTYRDDFTTIEKPATTNVTTYGPNAIATSLVNNLVLTPYVKENDSQKLLGTLSALA